MIDPALSVTSWWIRVGSFTHQGSLNGFFFFFSTYMKNVIGKPITNISWSIRFMVEMTYTEISILTFHFAEGSSSKSVTNLIMAYLHQGNGLGASRRLSLEGGLHGCCVRQLCCGGAAEPHCCQLPLNKTLETVTEILRTAEHGKNSADFIYFFIFFNTPFDFWYWDVINHK